MFIDLGRMESGQQLRTQVCIVGGGMAGLVMAMELERAGIASVVLESGGLEADEATRDLHRGTSSGSIPYHYGDGCRSRYLGGSSNCWAGFCRAFDESDLATRPWVPHSGWPISHSELVPYFQRAHDWLALGPYNYDTAHWVRAIGRADVRQLPLAGSGLTDAVSHFSGPVRMGRRYHWHLHQSRLITVALHANLTRFDCDADGTRVVGVQASSLNQRHLHVSADEFVLAAGGIENPRLLLACSPQHPAGLGNQHDQVGRYFMDHPRMELGQLRFHPEWSPNRLYDTKYNFHHGAVAHGATKVAGQLFPTAEVKAREGLTNSVTWFNSVFAGEFTPQAEALVRLKQRLLGKRFDQDSAWGDLATVSQSPRVSARFAGSRWWPRVLRPLHARVACIVEPVPDPQSRLTLGSKRDALGLPRAHVHWQLTDQARTTFQASLRRVQDLLSQRGIATIDQAPSLPDDPSWRQHLHPEGTWHHMGTTRMSASPRLGVVDKHCQVHGMRNLHVAGSSVFCTAGANYPTVNLVALAVRLADRLAERGSSTQSVQTVQALAA